MSEYIFRFPKGTPNFDFDSLNTYMSTHPWFPYVNGGRYIKIGTTVTLTYRGPQRAKTAALPPAFDVRLYGVLIARIFPDGVYFTDHRDGHMATTYWLEKIICDNGIGSNVGRIRKRVGDPVIRVARGYACPLAIGWDRAKLVEGHFYPADRERIAANRDFRERWDAEMKFRREHPSTWEADLRDTVPNSGMPDYRLPQPERAIEWGIRQDAARARNNV